MQDDGSILLYDNGNMRPETNLNSPDITQHPYSRAVLFSLDDADKTVTQKWEMRSLVDGRQLWAFFVGDADHQPNGNILVDNGASPIPRASARSSPRSRRSETREAPSCSRSASTTTGHRSCTALVEFRPSTPADSLGPWPMHP